MGQDVPGPLADGRAALRVGDAAAARAAFERAAGDVPSGAVLEGMSAASYVLMDFPRSIDELERAYAAYRAAGDGVGAVRAARALGYLHGSTTGDWAVAYGWIARAKRILVDLPDSSERGWVALTQGMFDPQRARKEQHYAEAIEVGRRTGDTQLVCCTLAYLGASMVHADRAEEGMQLLDEALAAVVGGDVEDFIVVEEIFCQMFSACERAHDVGRAEQWIRVGEQVAAKRGLPVVSAYCSTHYGGILTAAGRWPEADATLTEAVRLWALCQRTLRAGAVARLADLRVRQGRLDEAALLLADIADDAEATRPLAALHLARGQAALAREVLDRALQDADPGSSNAIPLLAMLADVHLAAGDPEAAADAVDALATCTEAHPDPYALALTALARGRLALATGHGDPRAWLRQALQGFGRASLPLEAAICRLDLARACNASSPEVAVAEARAALEAFGRLEAARHVDDASAMLRSLGVRVASPRGTTGTLTAREADVLALLGEGLSNPEIASRLFISRKTVEHHVGNILVKLGLRNRAEAAAYAVRRDTPASK